MPGLRSVSSLQQLCLRSFSALVSDRSIDPRLRAERAAEHADAVRRYLQRSAPPVFLEELVHATLAVINKYFYQPKHRAQRPCMVAVVTWLLGGHMRHLCLDTCRMLCDRLSIPHVFDCLRRMGRLQTLAIGRLNVWKIPELATLPDRLSGLPYLTSLRLEYICQPEMLTNLATKCPRLCHLSLKDSASIGDTEVPEIIKCKRLEALDISGTSVTGAGSWEIISSLTKLTSFEHCPFNCNSGPFLFDSREEMLSYIWDFLSPAGREQSAALPSVTREMSTRNDRQQAARDGSEAVVGDSPERAGDAGGGGCQGGAGDDRQDDAEGLPVAGQAQRRESHDGTASDENVVVSSAQGSEDLATAVSNAEVDEPRDVKTSAPSETDTPLNVPQPTPADGPPPPHPSSRESSVGADLSSCSSSVSSRRSPHPLSRSASDVLIRPLNIHNFWLFNPKTEEAALARLCPAVRRLRLDFAFQDIGMSPDLYGLSLLHHVTRLDLSSYDSPRFSVIHEVLRRVGAGLSHLSVHICDDYTATAAIETLVARFCPNLESYSFTGDYSIRHPVDRGDDDLDFTIPERHRNLKSLKLGGFVTGRRLMFILAHAAHISSLYLDGELRYLDDVGFDVVTTANPLLSLQDLWINVSSGLTVRAVLPLILDLRSQLRRLGRLSSLEGMSRSQYLELRKQVGAMNMDIELVWVTEGV